MYHTQKKEKKIVPVIDFKANLDVPSRHIHTCDSQQLCNNYLVVEQRLWSQNQLVGVVTFSVDFLARSPHLNQPAAPRKRQGNASHFSMSSVLSPQDATNISALCLGLQQLPWKSRRSLQSKLLKVPISS